MDPNTVDTIKALPMFIAVVSAYLNAWVPYSLGLDSLENPRAYYWSWLCSVVTPISCIVVCSFEGRPGFEWMMRVLAITAFLLSRRLFWAGREEAKEAAERKARLSMNRRYR